MLYEVITIVDTFLMLSATKFKFLLFVGFIIPTTISSQNLVEGSNKDLIKFSFINEKDNSIIIEEQLRINNRFIDIDYKGIGAILNENEPTFEIYGLFGFTPLRVINVPKDYKYLELKKLPFYPISISFYQFDCSWWNLT